MMQPNAEQKRSWPLITTVRRPPVAGQQKVTPLDDEDYQKRSSIQAKQSLPSLVLRKDSPLVEPTKPLPIINTDEKTEKHSAAPTLSKASSHESNPNKLTEAKKSSGGIKGWYSGLTSKQKMLLRIGIVAGIFLLCAIIAVLLVLFLLLLRSSSTTTTTTTRTTTSTTTASPVVISASWNFDQTAADFYGVYNGSLMSGASYSAASTSQPYIGNGRALSLTATTNQAFIVSTPYLNLTYTSFTVEAWIYSANIANDRGIFCQCGCSTCLNQCVYFIVRSGRLYADFTLNGFYGSTILSISTWYHVAFVYNYATKQQILYVNGVQDGIASNVQPYQGTNGSIQIGSAQISLVACYFIGYIDNVKLTTRAKSSTEILSDASLTAYYSFDLSSLNTDSGPNGLDGSLTNAAVIAGRVNQAIHFSGSSSYFQAYGFYRFPYSITNQAFSVSLWVNPSALTTSVIVQSSTLQLTGPCFNFMGIMSASGGSTGQIVVEGWAWPQIYGSFLTLNTWTHITATYSTTNGIILYINGVLFGTTGPCSMSNSGSITWLIIGYNFACSGSVSNGAYQGSIDEVYVHSRELTPADIFGLANP